MNEYQKKNKDRRSEMSRDRRPKQSVDPKGDREGDRASRRGPWYEDSSSAVRSKTVWMLVSSKRQLNWSPLKQKEPNIHPGNFASPNSTRLGRLLFF